MSYDVGVYFGRGAFPEQAYGAFVASSLRLLGNWTSSESYGFNLRSVGKLHEYRITNALAEGLWDIENDVSVWVSLHRNRQELCDPPLREFQYLVSVETGAGRSSLSMLIQLLVPLTAFDYFGDVLVEDVQEDDPENAVVYARREEYLRHVIRLCRKWYGCDFLKKHGVIDANKYPIV